MTEPSTSRTWYLGAAAAAGALAAPDACATIIHQVGPWDDNPPAVPIDIIQGDEIDPLLTFRDAKIPATNGTVMGLTGTEGVLQLWQITTPFVRVGSGSVSGGVTFGPTALSFQTGSAGMFLNGAVLGSDNYFGFRVTDPDVNSGSPVYGWARIDIPDGIPGGSSLPADASIVEFAYQDDGSPIGVGDTGAAIPEPSTLGLLALGATGLAALRRRKKSS